MGQAGKQIVKGIGRLGKGIRAIVIGVVRVAVNTGAGDASGRRTTEVVEGGPEVAKGGQGSGPAGAGAGL